MLDLPKKKKKNEQQVGRLTNQMVDLQKIWTVDVHSACNF